MRVALVLEIDNDDIKEAHSDPEDVEATLRARLHEIYLGYNPEIASVPEVLHFEVIKV